MGKSVPLTEISSNLGNKNLPLNGRLYQLTYLNVFAILEQYLNSKADWMRRIAEYWTTNSGRSNALWRHPGSLYFNTFTFFVLSCQHQWRDRHAEWTYVTISHATNATHLCRLHGHCHIKLCCAVECPSVSHCNKLNAGHDPDGIEVHVAEQCRPRDCVIALGNPFLSGSISKVITLNSLWRRWSSLPSQFCICWSLRCSAISFCQVPRIVLHPFGAV